MRRMSTTPTNAAATTRRRTGKTEIFVCGGRKRLFSPFFPSVRQLTFRPLFCGRRKRLFSLCSAQKTFVALFCVISLEGENGFRIYKREFWSLSEREKVRGRVLVSPGWLGFPNILDNIIRRRNQPVSLPICLRHRPLKLLSRRMAPIHVKPANNLLRIAPLTIQPITQRRQRGSIIDGESNPAARWLDFERPPDFEREGAPSRLPTEVARVPPP